MSGEAVAIKNEDYHVTDRWDPSPEYRAAFREVLSLTGFHRDYFDQY